MGWSKAGLLIACSLLAITAMADSPRNIALLASSCAACHGTHGNSIGKIPVLAGLSEPYFIEQMKAFKQGKRPAATVMMHHASGYTEDEIRLLAKFFAKQKRGDVADN